MHARKPDEARHGPPSSASTEILEDEGRRPSAAQWVRPPSEPSGPDSSPRADSTAERERHMMRQSMRIGLWVWPSFALLDAYMCHVLYPDAPFPLFVLYRTVVELAFWGVYRATWRQDLSVRLLGYLVQLTFLLAAVGIALMAIHLGGLRSAYMHGISLVCLVYAAVRPGHWRRSLVTFLPVGLAFPIVMGAAALLSPSERAEWYSLKSLAIFAANYVFVAASSVIGMVCGHAVWTARQQLYRARKLGRYRLEAPIGTGGMGEVWLAWDAVLRRSVALKLLRVSSASTGDLVRRFEREAHAASQLRGPHAVRIYDFGASDDGICYIVMEYLCGADLHTLVREHGPLPPSRAVGLAIQACLALEEAHEAGIVHRDIKPQNLFVTSVGEDQELIKLLDFGLARFHAVEASVQLTHTGLVLGTPAYMAPELWQGAAADPRSDVYALGATLYFMLVGAPPFECDALGDFLRAHLAQPPAPPSARRGSPLPAGLDEIVLRCLEKSPAMRFPSARELRAALAEVHHPEAWTPADVRAFWQMARAALPHTPARGSRAWPLP